MANGVSTGTESETGTASRTAAASTEGRILDVATVLFYEHGYHATTMRDVAAGVGIKAGSLYNHYASKEELLFQIAEGVMQDLPDGRARKPSPPPRSLASSCALSSVRTSSTTPSSASAPRSPTIS